LATLPPRTLVLFADAYDVLYAADGAALRRRYEERHVPPEKVLVGRCMHFLRYRSIGELSPPPPPSLYTRARHGREGLHAHGMHM
jgi:hypothetical protein